MNKALIKVSAAVSLFALPLLASAQTPTNLTTFISFIGDTLNRLIPVLIAAAVLVFFWGLINYIRHPEKPGGGKNIMIAGIVAIFLMVSIWGVIRLVQNTFGINGQVPVTIPQVPQR